MSILSRNFEDFKLHNNDVYEYIMLYTNTRKVSKDSDINKLSLTYEMLVGKKPELITTEDFDIIGQIAYHLPLHQNYIPRFKESSVRYESKFNWTNMIIKLYKNDKNVVLRLKKK